MNLDETQPPTSGERTRRRGRLITAFVIFVAATIAFRVFLIAPPEQRGEVADNGRFATVWEAWRTLGNEHPADDSATSNAAAEAVKQMAIVASEDPITLSDRLLTLNADAPSSVPEGLEDVWRAWRLLRNDYADVSSETLARAAISGLGLDSDPALRYLSKDEFESLRDYFGGDTYAGIGAFVSESPRGPMIDEVFTDEPADLGGLDPGDVILSVDGQSTADLSLDRVVEIIRGPSGSMIELEILPASGTVPKTVVITRATVPGPSLRSEVLEGEIGYIWLFRFHSETGDEFRRKLAALMEEGIRGLVLDMRDNPGGSLNSAVKVASEFLSDGIVMYEISNDGARDDWPVREDGIAPDLPLAVIVNGASASAAEVIAGALQAHQRAKLFGTRTYGKGSVQTFRPLSDGSALYLTVAYWHTPDGRLIQDRGIDPDVPLSMSTRSVTDVPLVVAYSAVLDLAGLSDGKPG